MTGMPRHDVYRSHLAAYIWFWLFLAVSSVEDPPEDCQPIGAQFPLTLLIFLSVPAIFGFLSGRKSWRTE